MPWSFATSDGPDDSQTVTITAEDEDGASSTATFELAVDNVAPTAVDDSGPGFETDEDTAFPTANVLNYDTDPGPTDVLEVTSLHTTGTKGLVTDNGNGTFNYNPNDKFENLAVGESTTDSFTYTVSDGDGGSATATVTILIAGVNDDPTADGDSATTDEDTAIDIDVLSNDSDPDTIDLLTVGALDSEMATGWSNVNFDGTIRYDPNGEFNYLAVGETMIDTLGYTVSDGNGGTDTATVTVTISGVNDVPNATNNNNSIDTDASSPATGNLISDDDGFGTDSDPDTSDTLTVNDISCMTDPSTDVTGDYGTLSWGTDGSYSYTLDSNNADVQDLGEGEGETLTDTFAYTLSDGHGGTSSASLAITILPHVVEAYDDAYGMGSDPILSVSGDQSVLANDVDGEPSHSLSAVLTSGPSHAVDFNFNSDGSFTYEPEPGWGGTDTFTYQATDGIVFSDPATVEIGVVVVQGWQVEREKSEDDWVEVAESEWTWIEDNLRWTVDVSPGEPDILIDGIEWEKRPWGDSSAVWEVFTSTGCDCPATGNPGVGHWEVRPVVYYFDPVLAADGEARGRSRHHRVATIERVEWVGVDPGDGTNLQEDEDGNGFRIFPDRNSFDGPDHSKVQVRVVVAPGVDPPIGEPVWLLAVDADDPSSDQAPIDNETDAGGNWKLTDNRGKLPWVVVKVQVQESPDGPVAVHEFDVSRFAGDNYRIVASARPTKLTADFVKPVVDNNGAAETSGRVFYDHNGDDSYRPADDDQVIDPVAPNIPHAFRFVSSPLLTVWRRLYVEADSMGPPELGILYSFDANEPVDDPTPDEGIPGPDLSALDGALLPAFIEVERLPEAGFFDPPTQAVPGQSNIPLRRDLGTPEERNKYLLIGPNATRQTLTQRLYWTIYVATIYEFYDQSTPLDNDPTQEETHLGVGRDGAFSLVLTEVIRDVAVEHGYNAGQVDRSNKVVALHEVGHQLGLAHDPDPANFPNHIMTIPPPGRHAHELQLVFKDDDIRRIRMRSR